MDTAARWNEIKRVFLAVSEAAPGEREALLRLRCAGDADVESAVRSLLDAEPDGRALDGRPAQAIGLRESEPAAPWWDAALPRRLGRYALVELIGSGAHGAVFRAIQDNAQREVAVKILDVARLSAQARERFAREALALGRLEHPGIARLYDASPGDDLTSPAYIAMELVRGEDIASFVRTHGLGWLAVLELFARVCDAVEFAHRNGVVHRDLKPGNILVTAEGEPKVLDFGVARLLDRPGSASLATLTGGELLGTVGYMSPEQLAGGAREVTPASDVYSLGLVLHELLTGQPVMDMTGLSLIEALDVARSAQPLSPVAGNGRRGELDAILHKCLERSPLARYASAGALGEDLRRRLARRPVLARRPTALRRAARLAQRNHKWIVGALLAVLIVAALARIDLGRERRSRLAYEQARDSLGVVLHDLTVTLGEQAGTAAARESVLLSGLAAIDGFVRTHPEDVAARVERARALLAISDVELQRGDVRGARERRVEAESVLRAAAAAKGVPPSVNASLCGALVRVGDLLKDAGDVAGARARYAEARAIIDADVVARPTDVGALAAKSWSLERFTDLEIREGRSESARAAGEERLAVARKVAARTPGAGSQFGVASALMQLGRVYADLGQPDRQANCVREATRVARALVAARPEHRGFLKLLVHTLCAESKALYSRGEVAAEQAAIEEAVAMGARLVAYDASDEDAVSGLVSARHTLARFHIARGDRELGLRLLAQVVADRRSAASQADASEGERDGLLRALAELAMVSSRVGNEPESQAATTEALEVGRLLCSRPNPSIDHLLIVADLLIRGPIIASRDPSEAVALAEAAVERSEGANVDALLLLARANAERGDAGQAARRLGQAERLLNAEDSARWVELEELRSQMHGKR